MRQQGISGWRGLHAGACHAWPLPADATCAAVARQVFRGSGSEVIEEPGFLDDCILMASELAANTLHARMVAGAGGGGDQLLGGEPITSASPAAPYPAATRAGHPELWLYLRGLGVRRELVCKIFDSCRGWRPGPRRAPTGSARSLSLPARPGGPPGARLQDLRLLPRLAARLRAVGVPGVGPVRSRARPADRA